MPPFGFRSFNCNWVNSRYSFATKTLIGCGRGRVTNYMISCTKRGKMAARILAVRFSLCPHSTFKQSFSPFRMASKKIRFVCSTPLQYQYKWAVQIKAKPHCSRLDFDRLTFKKMLKMPTYPILKSIKKFEMPTDPVLKSIKS